MDRFKREQTFIKKSEVIHNNYYSYDKVLYETIEKHVIISCPIHGIFKQTPKTHLNGHGCKKCADDKKRLNNNIDEIIKLLYKKHKNKYQYPKLFFNKNSDFILIICPIHGDFKQRLSDHLSGHSCPKCGKTKLKTINEFIIDSNLIHNKYDYSKFIYVNSKTKGIIICPVHGEFNQTPNMHLNGYGCPKCTDRKSNKSIFIEKSNNVHNNFYNYDKVIYEGSDKYVTITCPIHGDFQQRVAGHLQGFGCIKCNRSKGEIKIEKILKEKNIKYDVQKYFEGCKNINKLYFDFYLPDFNMAIEYDGEFHFKNIFENNNVEKQKERDNIKNQFCVEKNIKLIRIPYTDFKNIEIIFKNFPKIYNSGYLDFIYNKK